MFFKLRMIAVLSLSALTLFTVPASPHFNGKGGRPVADGFEQISGGWEIEAAGNDKIRLRMHRRDNDSVSLQIPLARLQGLNSAQVNTDAPQANFRLVRDAGTFTFTGLFKDGKGTGTWRFKGNAAFADELRKHGYGQVTHEDLCVLALSDVGMAYIGDLEQAGYNKLTISQLVGLYTNDVSTDYIAGVGSVGYKELSPSDLVSLRSNGITAEDAGTLSKLVAGYIPAMQLIALKSNGVTETYIRSLEGAGYKNMSARQLIALRTNGVTRDFIDELRRRGHTNLTIEQIIRLHNTTGDQY
jgi:hypothetical protein